MRMHELLASQREEVLRRWMAKVERELPASPLRRPELQDEMPAILEEVIQALKRHAGEPSASIGVEPPSESHAEHRLRLGYRPAELVREYGFLHLSILETARAAQVELTLDEAMALVRCINRSIAASLALYVRLRDDEQVQTSARHLAFLAHELRNPLASARLVLSILQQRGLAGDGRLATRMERSLSRLGALIDQSLVQTRLEARAELQRTRLRLDEVLADLATEMAMEAEAKGIQIVFQVPEGLSTDADKRYLASAVGNLLRNAVKFTRPNGTVTLRAAESNGVRIEVEDECGGLPEGRAEELFTPFVQRSNDKSGFGLGLAIAQHAVEAHGGRIGVRSLPGRGCVFWIELPRASEGD